MSRTHSLLLAALAAVALSACGIRADDGPREITQDQQPDDVDPDAQLPSDGPTLLADLYFARFDGSRDNLVTVEREVPTGSSSSTPTPGPVLEALLAGVPDDETGDIVTKIPADTRLDGQPVLDDAGVLTIYLTPTVSGVQSNGARLAYGQMVCTADALDQVEGVLFVVDDQPVQAPTGAGETSSAPLTCDSYTNLLESPDS
jgi:spore germination protein GerM